MQSLLLVGVVAFVVLTGCSSECTGNKVKAGDRCVAGHAGSEPVADEGSDAEAVDDREAGKTVEVDEAGAEQVSYDDASRGSSVQFGRDGGPVQDAGAALAADGAVQDAANGGSAAPCQPNPCGHGTCAPEGKGFACACDADWSATPLCTVNTNAKLKDVGISAGSLFPAFRSDVREYSINLGMAEPIVALTPIAAQPEGATVRVGQAVVASGAKAAEIAVDLNGPTKKVEVRVEANDGISTQTYTFIIRRTLVVQSELETSGFGGVSLSENRLAIGDPANAEVDLYARSSGRWTYERSIKNNAALATSTFGQAVALNSELLVVGAADANAALAVGVMDGQRYALRIAPSLAGLQFGTRVAVGGNRILIANGARAAGSGVTAEPAGAFVFEKSGAEYVQVARFLPDSTEGLECLASAIEGDVVALGCISNSKPQGAVLIFERKDGAWMRTSTLRPPLTVEPHFGGSVAISRGRVVATSSYSCLPTTSGCDMTANVYVFSRDANGSWIAPAAFGLDTGPSVPQRSLPFMFGTSVAFDGSRVLVGAFYQYGAYGVTQGRTVGSQPEILGGALLFGETANGWALMAQIGPPMAAPNSSIPQRGYVGTAITMAGGNVAVWAASELPGTNAAVFALGPDCAQTPLAAAVPGC